MMEKRLIKIKRTTIIFLACFIISCTTYEPKAHYSYNNHPTFTWGQVEFYGNYYGKYNNPNNVMSLYLFSDSLKLNDVGSVIGIGQELILEDILIAPTDTILPIRSYSMDTTKTAYTFAPGRNVYVNNENIILGARILFMEKEIKKTVTKLIIDGSFSIISSQDSTMNLVCDLTTEDKIKIKGSFKGKPKFHDNSTSKISSVQINH